MPDRTSHSSPSGRIYSGASVGYKVDACARLFTAWVVRRCIRWNYQLRDVGYKALHRRSLEDCWLLWSWSWNDTQWPCLATQRVITCRVSRRRREMYSGHGRLCVPLFLVVFPLLHGPGCSLGAVHYWADLQSVHWFRSYDSIALTAKCQRAIVLALCLVMIVKVKDKASLFV